MKYGVRFLFIPLLLLYSTSSLACGTVDNWMDVYEGVDSGHSWRDSSNQREALTMLLGCGGSGMLSKTQQQRLLNILTDAMSRKMKVMRMRRGNRDIRHDTKFSGWNSYEGLVESLFHRFNCLQEVRTPDAPTFPTGPLANKNWGEDPFAVPPTEQKGVDKESREERDAREKAAHEAMDKFNSIVGKYPMLDAEGAGPGLTLYQYFGENSCPGHPSHNLKVKAPSGARLRAEPKGRVVASLNNGTLVEALGFDDGWYRVINPHNNGGQDTGIGYLHESVVQQP